MISRFFRTLYRRRRNSVIIFICFLISINYLYSQHPHISEKPEETVFQLKLTQKIAKASLLPSLEQPVVPTALKADDLITHKPTTSELTSKFTVAHLSEDEFLELHGSGLFYHLIRPSPTETDTFNVFADRTSRLAFCAILKSASTVMLAALCKKAGLLPLNESPTLISSVIHDGCVKGLPSIFDPDPEWNDERWKFWVLVRHPFQRFLSGWNDKCSPQRRHSKKTAKVFATKSQAKTCYGCYGNATCFLQRLAEVLQGMQTGLKIKHKYHAAARQSFHLFPQMWFGGLHKRYHRYDMIIRHGTTEEFQGWMRSQFSRAGYGSDILDRGWGAKGAQAFLEQSSQNKANSIRLSVRDEVAKEMANSIDLTEFYLRVYMVDHVFLRYELPDWTSALCDQCNASKRTDCEQLMICRVNNDWKEVLKMIEIYP